LLRFRQENRGTFPGKLHIEKEDQVLAGEGPAGQHDLLALPHPEESPAFEGSAPHPQRLLAGVADEHQIRRPVNPEGVPGGLLGQAHIVVFPRAEGHPLEAGVLRRPFVAHLRKDLPRVVGPPEPTQEDLERGPAALGAADRVHQGVKL
jgi:hypothetical protein